MPERSSQEKTEKPTPRRRRKAREQGQVARSQELAGVGVLMGGVVALWVAGGYMYGLTTQMLSHFLGHAEEGWLDPLRIKSLGTWAGELGLKIMAPVLVAVFVGAALVNLAQIGFLVTPKRIVPELDRINPISGFKRLFSLRSLVELAKSVGKLLVVGAVSYFVLLGQWQALPGLVQMSVGQVVGYIIGVCMKLFFYCALAMIVLAVLDFAYQKWDYEKNLRMSRQELKDEFKQTEGDPLVRARIRSIQREMARKRMMSAVPTADVVITNPVHLAVALRYEVGVMPAPEVVAKGKGKLAERIKELARAAGVPVVEDPLLAQALYKSVEVGESIPQELYEAVASVLAYVYRMAGRQQQVLNALGGSA